MANVAFIVGNSSSLDSDLDTPFKNRLDTTLGHTVTVVDDDDCDTHDFSGDDMLVYSDSAMSDPPGSLKTLAKPVLILEEYCCYEFQIIDSGNAGSGSYDYYDYQDVSHHITTGKSLGTETVYTSNDDFGWLSSPVGDQLSNGGAYSTIQAVEKNTTLKDSSSAAERRVFLGAHFGSKLNSDGWEIFDNAVDWCLYGDAVGMTPQLLSAAHAAL